MDSDELLREPAESYCESKDGWPAFFCYTSLMESETVAISSDGPLFERYLFPSSLHPGPERVLRIVQLVSRLFRRMM